MIDKSSMIRCSLWLAVLPVLQAPLPTAIHAQERVQEICVSRMNRAGGDGREFGFRVRQSELAKFQQRGFRQRDCAGVRNSFAKASGHMCEVASLKNDALERDFEARYGISPSELCEISKR